VVGLMTKACDAEDLVGCFNLGWMKEWGQGTERAPAAAAALYERACNGDVVAACAQLGHIYQSGDGRPKDAARADKLLSSACERGAPQGCRFLGVGLVFEAEPARQRRGAELLRKGCDAGDAEACSHLAYLYHLGRGVEVDKKQARRLSARACRGGYQPACESSVKR